MNKGVSAEAVGKHLDLSRQRVGQLVSEGVLVRLKNGGFDLDDSRIRYIRWLRDDQRRAVQTMQRARLDELKAREIEIRIAEADHRLVELDEVFDLLVEIIGTTKAEFYGLPARWTRDPVEMERLRGDIDEILTKISERWQLRRDELTRTGTMTTKTR
jgi:hypothetical protein